MCWPHSKDNGTIEWRKTSRSPMPLFLSCVGGIAPCRIRLCFMTLLCCASLLGLLDPSTQSDAQNGKELSQIPTSRMTSPIGVRTFKLNQSLVQSKMTFSWITEHDRYMNAWVRSWRHGLKADRHHVGYLLKICDTWVLIGQNGYKKALVKPQRYGSMIDVKQWAHLVRSGWFLALLKKAKQGFKTNNGDFRSLVLEKR
jgi:hypothetical protein